MNKLKQIITSFNKKDDKGKIESMIFLIILAIITIVIIKIIIKKPINDKTNKNDIKQMAKENVNINTQIESKNEIENKLEKILSKLDGVGQVNVMITYSKAEEIEPVYNENSKEEITQENDKQGGVRTINQQESNKEVIYEEINGEKQLVTKSVYSPKIEGAIVIAQGGDNINIKTNIIQAVEAVTGLSTHKIQVFDMGKE